MQDQKAQELIGNLRRGHLSRRQIVLGMAFRMPLDLIAKRIVLGLIVYAIGAVAGAWLYKE